MDATELVDATIVPRSRRADETLDGDVDDTVVASVGGCPRPPSPRSAPDDTSSGGTARASMDDDDLDATGDSTVVLDEAQIRDARAPRRRER